MKPMLSVDHLSFAYTKDKQVLDNVSFKVGKGSVCALFGPNGCGKTTLFRCCLKFLKYDAGRILLDGLNVNDTDIAMLAQLAAYVPQEHKPSFSYLVRDVVLMGRTPYLTNSFQIPEIDKIETAAALRLVGIEDLAYVPYNQLSGGQRQLVIIARAVAQKTKVLFLDEPTSALDFSNQLRVWQLLHKIAHRGTTVIACTHDPNHVIWFCDRVVVMNNHGLISVGDPKKVLTEKVLDRIYPGACGVDQFKETQVIYPRELNNRG